MDCYDTLMTATGIGGDDRALEITRETYPNGYDFYLINLSPVNPIALQAIWLKQVAFASKLNWNHPLLNR